MPNDEPTDEEQFSRTVGQKEARRLRARRTRDRGIWFWMGMFGLVGWSVSVPTLIGVGLGVWIDRSWPSEVSWTLTLLLAGMALGCWTAWYWISKESNRN
jgi:ATP synthase protein I